MGEAKLAEIAVMQAAAKKAKADRGHHSYNAIEALAMEIVAGKVTVSKAIMDKTLAYVLDLDKMRKKDRLESKAERRRTRRSKVEVEAPEVEEKPESVITPELEKRLMEFKENPDGH